MPELQEGFFLDPTLILFYMKNEGNGMFEGKKWERGGYVGGREGEGYLEGN